MFTDKSASVPWNIYKFSFIKNIIKNINIRINNHISIKSTLIKKNFVYKSPSPVAFTPNENNPFNSC